ncbi:MAG: diguanylate cyclase [Oscillatoriales cyanobacterium]|nr:MAG: diguanylate cyclase [Oscillatoriales cyanobacterium]
MSNSNLLTFILLTKQYLQASVRLIRSKRHRLEIGLTAVVLAITFGGTQLGIFELGECLLLDTYMRHRPIVEPDPRIVLVTINDQDLFDNLNQPSASTWPLPDDVIVETVQTINKYRPRVIGLHLYLTQSNDAARTSLKNLIKTTENLIGMEKVVGALRETPSLFPREQLAMSDMVLDPDASVRRALVSIYDKDDKTYLSWGAQLAVEYLATQSIKPVGQDNGDVLFGQAMISRLEQGDGGYSPQVDTGGFQIMMHYRGDLDAFTHIPLRDVRAGNFDPDLFRDKIVAIGPISPSLKTEYRTPILSNHSTIQERIPDPKQLEPSATLQDLSQDADTGFDEPRNKPAVPNDRHLMSSFLIHINLTSQLLDSALFGHQGLTPVPPWLKWGWVVVGASIRVLRDRSLPGSRLGRLNPMMSILVTNGLWSVTVLLAMLGVGYAAFCLGWWLPTIAPIVAFGMATGLQLTYHSYRLYRLASYDALTEVGNRRLFDLSLVELRRRSLTKRQPLALILCDIDWFKAYNDTYGHQQGDQCLKTVAQAIVRVVRHSDIVTRYGGEEFAILLPNTTTAQATTLAERICRSVRSLKLEHQGSKAETYVTLSCGVAVWCPDLAGHTLDFIEAADRALYRSKAQGRNTWQLETHWQDELTPDPQSTHSSITSSRRNDLDD